MFPTAVDIAPFSRPASDRTRPNADDAPLPKVLNWFSVNRRLFAVKFRLVLIEFKLARAGFVLMPIVAFKVARFIFCSLRFLSFYCVPKAYHLFSWCLWPVPVGISLLSLWRALRKRYSNRPAAGYHCPIEFRARLPILPLGHGKW